MNSICLYNGYALPAIGYGTFPQKESLVKSIPEAVSCGYRLVDVSDNYGNEAFAGQGLADAGDAGKDVVVVTKFSRPLKTRNLAQGFAASERRLGRKIDVYLLHWPYPFLWRQQWREMEDLYLAGRCKAIGVCNFDMAMLKKLLGFCRVKPMVDQFERHPLFQQAETADFCRANGIQVMCYSPFARMDEQLMGNEVLREIAGRHRKTIGQVILRWSIERGDLPIPASRSPGHIAENFAVSDFSLSQDDMKRIDALESGHRVRFDPRTRFGLRDKARFLKCRLRIFLANMIRPRKIKEA